MSKIRKKQYLLRYKKDLQRNLLAKPGAHPFVMVLDGLKAGFNVAKILRTAEVFGACAVHLINIGPFDPGPAKGALRKVPVKLFETFAESYTDLQAEGYHLFLLAPTADKSLSATDLPDKSAFILGHEEFGASFDSNDYPDIGLVGIPQTGQTESLNVSVAAGIVMYEYLRQQS